MYTSSLDKCLFTLHLVQKISIIRAPGLKRQWGRGVMHMYAEYTVFMLNILNEDGQL